MTAYRMVDEMRRTGESGATPRVVVADGMSPVAYKVRYVRTTRR
jgi:ribosomal protein L25 (general stress protein Ctc)